MSSVKGILQLGAFLTEQIAMVYYFEAIQRNIGYKIVPKWVMTDDAPQFYSAWGSVFGQGPQKLLYTWHVDRAWRANIRSKIQDEEVGALVPYSAYISRVFNFANFASLESLAKLFQQNF